jgi:hypothetical protein
MYCEIARSRVHTPLNRVGAPLWLLLPVRSLFARCCVILNNFLAINNGKDSSYDMSSCDPIDCFLVPSTAAQFSDARYVRLQALSHGVATSSIFLRMPLNRNC